jgi:biopolymer transport protein ExbD
MVKLRKKEECPVDFQMAPMIDMVFLLLVFFMCVGTVSVGEQIALQLPQVERDPDKKEVEDSLVVHIKADGNLVANGRLTTLEKWIQDMRHIHPEGQQILIRADASVPYSQIREVLDACAQVGISNVRYAVLEKSSI